MRARNQNPASDNSRFSREEIRTMVLFWVFWSAYALLSAFLIVALLTDWPKFLHEYEQFGR